MGIPNKKDIHGQSGALQEFECQVRLRTNPKLTESVTIIAVNKDAALTQLFNKGYLVLSVQEKDKAAKSVKSWFSFRRRNTSVNEMSQTGDEGTQLPPRKQKVHLRLFARVSKRELISFAIQLSALLQSGVPLIRSLQIIERGSSNHFFQKVLKSCIENLNLGLSFSFALMEHPKVFPSIWINLIEVGEASGKLPDVLREIAHYQDSAERIKSKVISALFYPCILVVVSIAAVSFLLTFVIPKFEAIFNSMGQSLPYVTQLVIMVSYVLRNYALWLVAIVFLVVAIIVYGVRTKTGKLLFDSFRLKLPIIGRLILEIAIVRLCRGMTTLVKAGVPILTTLQIGARLALNAVVERCVLTARDAVKAGKSVGQELEAANVFPPFMTQLIIIGEESGEMDRFLELISNYYEESVDTFLARLSTLLEPVLLIIMGAIIGTVVIAMFLPIVGISTGYHG